MPTLKTLRQQYQEFKACLGNIEKIWNLHKIYIRNNNNQEEWRDGSANKGYVSQPKGQKKEQKRSKAKMQYKLPTYILM